LQAVIFIIRNINNIINYSRDESKKSQKSKGGKKRRKSSIPSKARKGGKISKPRAGKVDTRKAKKGIGGGRKRR